MNKTNEGDDSQVSAEGEALLSEVENELNSNNQESLNTGKNEVQESDLGIAEVTMMVQVAFGIVAPNWKVTESECKELGRAIDVYVEKRFGGIGALPPEVALLFTAAIIVYPRIGTPLKKPDTKKDIIEGESEKVSDDE